uniref:Uncharacterized protein n=1 Tax=Sphenodon punctatus TaxID=8508 RepID=A0A8D0G8R6_SPHPU
NFLPTKLSGTNTCKFSSPGICTWTYNVNSAAISRILAKPRALEALSLYLISSEAVLSSALDQNSSQLPCRPESKNIPVNFSSIPAISLKQKQRKNSNFHFLQQIKSKSAQRTKSPAHHRTMKSYVKH